jgi:hypothetical protein
VPGRALLQFDAMNWSASLAWSFASSTIPIIPSGFAKDKEEIAKEFKAAFNMSDAQAAKIIRRITGRVRFFKRVFDLMVAM